MVSEKLARGSGERMDGGMVVDRKGLTGVLERSWKLRLRRQKREAATLLLRGLFERLQARKTGAFDERLKQLHSGSEPLELFAGNTIFA